MVLHLNLHLNLHLKKKNLHLNLWFTFKFRWFSLDLVLKRVLFTTIELGLNFVYVASFLSDGLMHLKDFADYQHLIHPI